MPTSPLNWIMKARQRRCKPSTDTLLQIGHEPRRNAGRPCGNPTPTQDGKPAQNKSDSM